MTRQYKKKELASKVCKKCGKTFYQTRGKSANNFKKRKYCSRECAGVTLLPPACKTCKICGKKFYQKRYGTSGPDGAFKKRKYCSRKRTGIALRVKEDAKTRRRHRVIEHYGGKCVCCGESHWQFLSLDHINNDGALHRKEVGNSAMYKWVEDNGYPATLQLLCYNCNMAKSFYGVCPHAILESV